MSNFRIVTLEAYFRQHWWFIWKHKMFKVVWKRKRIRPTQWYCQQKTKQNKNCVSSMFFVSSGLFPSLFLTQILIKINLCYSLFWHDPSISLDLKLLQTKIHVISFFTNSGISTDLGRQLELNSFLSNK